jgi:pimeloyl-ACP methyl ester carboxylesterase
MFDYVDLIKMIKTSKGLEDRAVIVGGGSYGGMLAAWLRMKYP